MLDSSSNFGISCPLSLPTLLSNVLFPGIFAPFVYIGDHAFHIGVSKDDTAILLSILGISNALGRLIAGWVADSPPVDPVTFHNVCLFVAGAATCVVPLIVSFELICVYLVVYGICFGQSVYLSHLSLIGFTWPICIADFNSNTSVY